jgi:hypothetical protein
MEKKWFCICKKSDFDQTQMKKSDFDNTQMKIENYVNV